MEKWTKDIWITSQHRTCFGVQDGNVSFWCLAKHCSYQPSGGTTYTQRVAVLPFQSIWRQKDIRTQNARSPNPKMMILGHRNREKQKATQEKQEDHRGNLPLSFVETVKRHHSTICICQKIMKMGKKLTEEIYPCFAWIAKHQGPRKQSPAWIIIDWNRFTHSYTRDIPGRVHAFIYVCAHQMVLVHYIHTLILIEVTGTSTCM